MHVKHAVVLDAQLVQYGELHFKIHVLSVAFTVYIAMQVVQTDGSLMLHFWQLGVLHMKQVLLAKG